MFVHRPLAPTRLYRLNVFTRAILYAVIGVNVIQTAHAKSFESTEESLQQASATSGETLKLTVAANVKKKNVVAAGTLGSRSNLETPYSTETVTAKEIENKQATTIAKLFEGEAGVIATGNTYNLNAYAVSVRGLPLDLVNGYKIDGHPFQMYGVELPLELFEQVQLLKGATGFLYGVGSPGGTINYISKKPTTGQVLSVDAGYSSDRIFSQHIDVGGHVGQDDRYGYRFNAVNEHGEAFNGTDVSRKAASLYLDAQITPRLKMHVNGLYQTRDLKGGITNIAISGAGTYAYSGTSLPSAISGSKNLTAYDQDAYYNSKVWTASTGLDWNINDNWRLDASYSRTYKQIESADETIYLRNALGDYNVAFRRFYRPTLVFDSAQSHLEGEFNTGWLKHKVVLGVDGQRLTRDLNIGNPALNPSTNTGGQNYVYSPTAIYPSGNLYGDSLSLSYTGTAPRDSFRISNWWTRSAFISDTLSVSDQWSLLLGLRHFDYSNKNYYVAGNIVSSYHKKPLTPTYALLYTPTKNTTFYASYVESLEDGGTVGSTYQNAYATLSPIESKQYEIGVKSEHKDWAVSSALFRIERGTGYANPQNYFVNDGLVRYQGLEANGSYRVTDGLKLLAGGAWIDAEYTKGIASVIGNEPTAVPHFQGNIGFEQNIAYIPGLEVHSTFNYIGQQYVNTTNTLQTKAYNTLSLGGSYKVKVGQQQQLTYRAEINNLLNKNYWVPSTIIGVNGLTAGAPRTLSLNIRYDF